MNFEKRTVHEWLQLWGEWERAGANYLAHLSPPSNMEIVIRGNVQQVQHSFSPSLDDDEAMWFCKLMSKLKSVRPDAYNLFEMVDIWQMSMREVSRRLGVSFESAARLYENAIGIIEGMMLAIG